MSRNTSVRLLAVGLAVPALLVLASPQAQARPASLVHVKASATLQAPADATVGYTYSYEPADSALAPLGAKVRVDALYVAGRTMVVLTARGLVPNREYGAHAHTKRCGPLGSDAGPHFQYQPDPVLPSVDPAYANADNEIWLDFTTDSKGRGWAFAAQNWQPAAERPASVIIHTEHTHEGTDGFPAGSAGARLACLTVGF